MHEPRLPRLPRLPGSPRLPDVPGLAGHHAELVELDRSTCLALLATQHVGRLIIDATPPLVRVVNYTAFEHTIVFRSDPFPHTDALLGSPVAFEADMVDDHTRSGWSVVVRGVAHDLSGQLAGFGQSGANVDPWAPGPKSRWIGINIEDVTGRLVRGEEGAVPPGFVPPDPPPNE